MVRGTLGEAAAATRFLVRLGPFLRETVDTTAAGERLSRSIQGRDQSFVTTIRRGILEHPASPYRRLLGAARIGIDDIERLTRERGVEGALERLHDAGVFVTLQEFKGLTPIARPGLELLVKPEDFDNPLSARDYEASTGGSGGRSRRIMVGLDLLEHEACYHAAFYSAHSAAGFAAALWLPAPPGAVAIKNVLIRARLGLGVDRWFSQSHPRGGGLRHRAFASTIRRVARASGWHLPAPEYTPASEALRVAQWLAEQRAEGRGAVLLTTPSAAVRTSAAALERGLDVRGSLFVVVGEPLTEAKAKIVSAAGSTISSHYAMVEAGMIGLACRDGVAPDDVHLVSDKVATIQRPIARNGATCQALFHSSLIGAAPKLMLNVESGDTGTIVERDCGCGVLPAGFRRHLHTIRSYEKLTSEGMHFLGPDLIALVEDVLVRRYGGLPTDWQLVEQEVQGLSKVSLMASPSIGAFDEADARRTVLEFLGSRGIGQRLMAEVWENGGTLQVVRAEPHVTAAGKIQPLQRL